MQILFLVSRYHKAGGHENVLNNLAYGISRLGHEVAIGAFSFEEPPPPPITPMHLAKLKRIPKQLDSGRHIDVIHSHHTKMNYYSLFESRPFVFHSHGASSKLQEINLKVSMLLCKNRISKIIYISGYAMSHVRSAAGISTLEIPSEVIYNGVDTNFFRHDLPQPYKKGNPQLLFVGNLYRHKNVIRIIEEMPCILRIFPNTHLQIVGQGVYYAKIKKAITNRKLDDAVEMVGGISNADLRLRYSSCDIYVSASYNEDFGIPLLEAMACGRPVLVSDIPSHSEIVRASGGGKVFRLSDLHGIKTELVDLIQRKHEYINPALEFARANDWSHVCKRISEIYESLVK